MKAKIKFVMHDRIEYIFNVEGTSQKDFYIAGLNQLNNIFNEDQSACKIIENWGTECVDKDGKPIPGKDKEDGIAARSTLQKVRFDLLPVAPIVEVIKVLTFGAYHYGNHNWQAGFSWSRCIGAASRHFYKWCLGEELDDESRLHHLAHVIANCLFLLHYVMSSTGTDDRQKASPAFVTELFKPINAEKKEV